MACNVTVDEIRGNSSGLAPFRKVLRITLETQRNLHILAECGHTVKRNKNRCSYRSGAPGRVRCEKCLEEMNK